MQGQGIKLLRFDTTSSPQAYVQQAGVVSVGDFDFSREAVDDTEMDQTSAWMEFVASALIDAGELEVGLKFDTTAASEQQLLQDFNTGTAVTYRIQLPEGSPNATVSFSAVITSFGSSHPATERNVRNVTFKISGVPTLSWASPALS